MADALTSERRELTPRELGLRALRERICAMGIPITDGFFGRSERGDPDWAAKGFLQLTRIDPLSATEEQFQELKVLVKRGLAPDVRDAHDALTLDQLRAVAARKYERNAAFYELAAVNDESDDPLRSTAAVRYEHGRDAARYRRLARGAHHRPARLVRSLRPAARAPRSCRVRSRVRRSREHRPRGRGARAPGHLGDDEPPEVTAVALTGAAA